MHQNNQAGLELAPPELQVDFGFRDARRGTADYYCLQLTGNRATIATCWVSADAGAEGPSVKWGARFTFG